MLCPALDRVLQLLQYEHCCALGQDESVPLGVEGARGAGRLVVALRQCAHRTEAGHGDRGDRRFCAATEHRLGATEADRVPRIADRHVRRSACSRFGEERSACPELDRDPAGRQVRKRLHDRERIDPVGASRLQLQNTVLERSHTPKRAGDRNTDAVAVRGHVQTGVRLSLPRRRDHQMRTAIHPARALPIDVLLHLEPFDLAGKARRMTARVEASDLRRAATPREQRLPRISDGVPDRAHHPETGDNDPSRTERASEHPTHSQRR